MIKSNLPLPVPRRTLERDYYTAEQMQAYANMAIEEDRAARDIAPAKWRAWLESHQWSGSRFDSKGWARPAMCPDCNNRDYDGHAKDCVIAELLSEPHIHDVQQEPVAVADSFRATTVDTCKLQDSSKTILDTTKSKETNKITTYWTVDNTGWGKNNFWFAGDVMHSTRQEAIDALIASRKRLNSTSIKWRIAEKVVESNPTTTTWRTKSYEEFPCLN